MQNTKDDQICCSHRIERQWNGFGGWFSQFCILEQRTIMQNGPPAVYQNPMVWNPLGSKNPITQRVTGFETGGPRQTWTVDQRIMSPLL